MALFIMVILALSWCAWLVWDAVQECRKIDRERSTCSTLSTRLISDSEEVR
jgi:hypothetical protein